MIDVSVYRLPAPISECVFSANVYIAILTKEKREKEKKKRKKKLKKKTKLQ